MLAAPLKGSAKKGVFERGEMAALEIRGKIGTSTGFGFAVFGGSKFADTNPNGGIYQKRRKGYNQHTGKPPAGSGFYYCLMRSYQPTYTRTEAQANQRDKMAAAINAWQSLTTNEKSAYNTRASKLARTGYHLFISEYLKTNGV